MFCAFHAWGSALKPSFAAKNAVGLRNLVSSEIGGGGGAPSRYRSRFAADNKYPLSATPSPPVSPPPLRPRTTAASAAAADRSSDSGWRPAAAASIAAGATPRALPARLRRLDSAGSASPVAPAAGGSQRAGGGRCRRLTAAASSPGGRHPRRRPLAGPGGRACRRRPRMPSKAAPAADASHRLATSPVEEEVSWR